MIELIGAWIMAFALSIALLALAAFQYGPFKPDHTAGPRSRFATSHAADPRVVRCVDDYLRDNCLSAAAVGDDHAARSAVSVSKNIGNVRGVSEVDTRIEELGRQCGFQLAGCGVVSLKTVALHVHIGLNASGPAARPGSKHIIDYNGISTLKQCAGSRLIIHVIGVGV